MAWRRGLSLPARAAVLAAGTLLAAPVSLLYDLMLPAVAVCWLLRGDGGERLAGWDKNVLAGLFILLLAPRDLAETMHLPVSLIAVIGVFAIAVRRMLLEVRTANAPDGLVPHRL